MYLVPGSSKRNCQKLTGFLLVRLRGIPAEQHSHTSVTPASGDEGRGWEQLTSDYSGYSDMNRNSMPIDSSNGI
jgi:hypothetical protein